MAETAAVKEPEKSLFERVGRVGNLLNQGVESMVYGTLSLPALVADGYLNIYRAGREAVGGEAFQESNLYTRSKQGLTDWGRKMDGSYGKVIGAQDATEQKIVFGTELVTGLVGPGAIKSLKTLAEGKTLVTGAAAAKPAATIAETTATTSTQAAAAPTVAKVKLATANEDVLSALSKAKAEGEAARAGATVAKATASAADDVAKTAAGAAATVTKPVMSKWEIRSFLARESNLPTRLEHLSGHGAAAESKITKLIAEARKEGISGADWTAIRSSRTLPQETIDSVGKVYNASANSILPGKLGPKWEQVKGSAAYAASYPGSAALDVAGDVAKFTLLTAPVTAIKNPTATFAVGAAGYVGYGTAVNYLSSGTPSSTSPESASDAVAASRDVSFTESFAKTGSQALVDASKFSAASLWTAGALAASKIPGIGDAALDGLRGTARTLVGEMAGGEKNEAVAWNKAKEKLSKFLPSASVDAMGDFVSGKDVKLMTPEQRARITDAMEAISSPNGDKAKVLLASAADEARQKAQSVAPSFTAGAQAAAGIVGGAAAAAGDALGDISMDDVTGSLGGVWDKAKQNPYTATVVSLAALYGFKSSSNKMEGSIKALAFGLMALIGMQILAGLYPGAAPAVTNLLKTGMDKMGIDTDELKSKFSAAANGRTNAPVSAPATDAPAAKSVVGSQFEQAGQVPQPAPATQPVVAPKAPTTGEDSVFAQFRNSGNEMTGQGDTAPAPQVIRRPAPQEHLAI